ncbi:Fis family transcriptional regulator [Bermanella marisrubri]|uniref:Fis family transcriptional regulator n=1 Tax=Bermanella marisrubri TaxID=207949 RepID=Q1N238_9GAMM|nr:hypothetical protein [Bermanella marisrubri]EAT12326.1 hypothetical protein RED65_15843 [Bermanella marisrubri]QIZ85412.1 Fis family transcriptional regulator [Bermanella marisrubri]
MRKTDKKLDNQLRQSLTDVCEIALQELAGFQWLTHTVDYSRFPQSLKIVCVFDMNDELQGYLESDKKHLLKGLIEAELSSLNITLPNKAKQVIYDTEENCRDQHDGNWSKRLS